ncbi:efflux transporter outer membrane subunit [Pseudomonas cichorii]|nr:efflux transporter outer membrane subunit [Pseudomonas cichorii]MBX8536416.1 efflux transporter outer membrane subunit [Pseudomonas cichorii]MBX8540326.1 efflux transporter outer membrane subunit [Pseudomonas cichorii]MBX8547744.1 efflux transporter outer membrane subunit [Pseudomonas cichorii]MBX8564068.1 efflux transporter outer membrane subunit [Pseudomonas cichorii]MBX8582311.1 efflux transporter outer membrane subunit [Pseudomonas cichorii]
MKYFLLSALAASMLGGCSLIPDYQRPTAPVAASYPTGTAYEAGATGPANQAAAEQGWRNFFRDPVLGQLIESSLSNNRDLRVAALNLEAYQAQYRIQRSDLFPSVSVSGSGTRQSLPADLSGINERAISTSYSTTLGISAYELDLVGRNRSLSREDLETYLSSEQARRSTQLSLVANVANAYFTWRADQEQLKLTSETLQTYEESLKLTLQQGSAGTASALAISQARTSVESARARLAQYERQVAQDLNALTLLVGASVSDNLPAQPLSSELLGSVPAGLPSELLQRRPDILQAEYLLKAANANIGAARAAFFPSISLTANAGTSSTELSRLFKAGSGGWLFQPEINIPIFNAGNLRASLDYSKIQKDIRVAQYEKSIQTAFQEVADGLAARQTYTEQLIAQRDSLKANEDYYRLAEARYRSGLDSSLTLLDAQRSLFTAQSTLISDRLAQLTAEINLYKALGGGWHEYTTPASLPHIPPQAPPA